MVGCLIELAMVFLIELDIVLDWWLATYELSFDNKMDLITEGNVSTLPDPVGMLATEEA